MLVREHDQSFSWWMVAKKSTRPPNRLSIKKQLAEIFEQAWPERVNRLSTIVGKKVITDDTEWLHSEGREGVLVYGPYMPLPAGYFSVRFQLSMEFSSAVNFDEVTRVDVISGCLKELASLIVTSEQLSNLKSRFITV